MAAAWFDLMHWYAIHTKPRQEAIAQMSLQREGIETFFPKLRQKRTIRRVNRWWVGSLFPRYIFAQFEPATSARLVKYATGVASIVSFGGLPAPVEPVVLDEIRAHAELDVVTLAPKRLNTGDRVEIVEGPLRGLQGIFRGHLRGSERVAILLNILQQQTQVVVDADNIEHVDD